MVSDAVARIRRGSSGETSERASATCVLCLAPIAPFKTKICLHSVDFVLTDPPYLVNYASKDGRTVPNDVWHSNGSVKAFGTVLAQ